MSAPAMSQRWSGNSLISLFFAECAFLVLGIALLPYFYNFAYKDEISYVAAAERYARGDFANAPNSYWGPLTSWLLAPLLWIGMPAPLAARLLSLGLGCATLYAARRLSAAFELPAVLQAVFLAILVPCLLYFALPFITADLLLTCLLVFYFAVIINRHYAFQPLAGPLCGVLGGLAYLAKAYALPFFLLHFTICSAAHLAIMRNRTARRMVLRHYAMGLIILAMVVSGWAAIMAQKYGEFTTGLTGRYNWEIVGPGALGRPIFYIGFVPPPESTTVSIWEDPWHFYDLPQARACCLKPWSPFQSASEFQHQLSLIRENISRTISIFLKFSLVSPLIIVAAVAVLLAAVFRTRQSNVLLTAGNTTPEAAVLSQASSPRGRRASLIERILAEGANLPVAMALLTFVVYSAPYTLIYSDERYLWPMFVLMLALALHLSARGFAGAWFKPPLYQPAAVALLSLSFLHLPARHINDSFDLRRTTTAFARQLEAGNLQGASFASNTDYGASVCVAYHVNAKYFGLVPAGGMSDEAVAEKLSSQGVDYYLMWDALSAPRPGMDLVRELKSGGRTLAIYAVRSKAAGGLRP